MLVALVAEGQKEILAEKFLVLVLVREPGV